MSAIASPGVPYLLFRRAGPYSIYTRLEARRGRETYERLPELPSAEARLPRERPGASVIGRSPSYPERSDQALHSAQWYRGSPHAAGGAPITPRIIRLVLTAATTGTYVLKGVRWALSNWDVFIVMAWMAINLSVGSRKGESTRLPGDESSNDWFTRRSLTWNISHTTIVDPT